MKILPPDGTKYICGKCEGKMKKIQPDDRINNYVICSNCGFKSEIIEE